MHHRRSAASENKIRLYWAFFRIFIALTSSAFFLYFLVIQIQGYIQMEQISHAVEVARGVIDWVDVSLDEEQCAVSLMRNTTRPIPQVRYAGQYDYGGLLKLQEETLASLKVVVGDCDEAGYITTERETLQNASQVLQESQQEVLQRRYEWDSLLYDTYVDALHGVRMTLLDIISKHVIYEDNTVAQQSIILQTLFYYMENVGMMRDAMLLLSERNNPDWILDRDNVIGYKKGMATYERALNQRIVGDLRDKYMEVLKLEEWIRCNLSIEADIKGSVYANFSIVREDWFNCTSTLIYQMRPLAVEIKDHLATAEEDFRRRNLSSLIISVVGICMELMAAATLIQQAVPVIMLYKRFSNVVQAASKSPSRSSSFKEGKEAGSVKTSSSAG